MEAISMQRQANLELAYSEGHRAGRLGLSPNLNQYPEADPLRAEWERGRMEGLRSKLPARAREPHFALKWPNQVHNACLPLSSLLESSEHDEELRAWAQRAPVDGCFMEVGAERAFWFRRIA